MGKTSTAVKQRYIDKTYSKIVVAVPKQTAADFREKCKTDGISQAQVIKAAINDFLEDKKR